MTRRRPTPVEAPPVGWIGAENRPRIILAHGAGAGRTSPFMTEIAGGLAERGLRTGLFDFPYMAEMQRTGRRRPPDPMSVLTACWKAVITETGREQLVIGGKSMGGRVASLVADECGVAGLVCLGFPFHAPGRPPGARIEHLRELTTATLLCQGERDAFGARREVSGYRLARTIRVTWLPDGDHGFRPRRRSGFTESENLGAALDAVAEFVRAVAP